MNCTNARKEIIDATASRESALPVDLHQHVRACHTCRAFFATQASLAAAVDSHLQFIANESAPPSLLPAVRARIAHETVSRRRIFAWQFATFAVAVVLLVAVGIRMLRSDTNARLPGAVAQITPESPIANRPVSPQVEEPAPKTSGVAAAGRKASIPTHSSSTEVLVLPEEQQAFRRFVSHIAQDQNSAKALAAAADRADAPVEIALLAITNVEVKPLEGTDSE